MLKEEKIIGAFEAMRLSDLLSARASILGPPFFADSLTAQRTKRDYILPHIKSFDRLVRFSKAANIVSWILSPMDIYIHCAI